MVKTITVAELIEFLKGEQQDLIVAYQCCSEQVLLEVGDTEEFEACEPRPNGWVQCKRPDMSTRKYLLFPGN